MKKLVSLVFLIIVLFFGHITLWQLLLPDTTPEKTPKYDWGQGSEQPWWNEYTTPQPQQDIVVPFSPEYSDSPEAQELKKKQEEAEKNAKKCNWIKLNTDFPLIGNCIHLKKWEWWVDSTTVLPVMIWSLMKITMSVVMVVCFIMIIIAGIKRSSNSPKEAQDLIKKVAITVLLLWLSGVILKVINPLFFS